MTDKTNTDRIRNQRMVCEKLCYGVFMRRPTLGMVFTAVLSILTIVGGSVFAYWNENASMKAEIKAAETDVVWIKKSVEETRHDIAEIKQHQTESQKIVISELKKINRKIQ